MNDYFDFLTKMLGKDRVLFGDDFIEIEEAKNIFSRSFRIYSQEHKDYKLLKIFNKEEILKQDDKDFILSQIKLEIEVHKSINHPNILNLETSKETDICIYLIFEDIDENLSQFIKNGNGLSNVNYKQVIQGIVNGVLYLQEKGIFHRDLKPASIYTIKENNKIISKIANLTSCAKIGEIHNEKIGTISYMAPEVIQEINYDEKCDLWSLGITFYEIYDGSTPYGSKVDEKKINSIFFSNQDYFFGLISIKNLNILIKRLLTLDPSKRINFKELKEYVFNDNFMNEDIININQDKINDEIYKLITDPENCKKAIIKENIEIKECDKNDDRTYEEKLKDLCNSINSDILPNILDIPNGEYNNNKKYNNIIYYVHEYFVDKTVTDDCKEFGFVTNGAFIFCTNFDSLGFLLKEEISFWLKQKNKDCKFNLITSGSAFNDVYEFITKNKYDDIFENICIYCGNLQKYLPLKEKYAKVKGVFTNAQKVSDEFIIKYASDKIKPYPLTKVLEFNEYKFRYMERHEKISLFYNNLNKELYKKAMEQIIKVIENDKDIHVTQKQKAIAEFKDLENSYNDLESFNQKIIISYSKDSIYGFINKRLYTFTEKAFECIALFTSRLMKALNSYGKLGLNKYYFKENSIIYRGTKIPYSLVLNYQRLKGEIITIASFFSTSVNKKEALSYAGRKTEDEAYPGGYKISILFYIENKHEQNWIPNGVDIKKISTYKKEEEVLYLPFTFFRIKDVKVDLVKKIATINLETIGRREILEEKMDRDGEVNLDGLKKFVKYDLV